MLTDVEFNWTCYNYDNPIWIFGASYFSLGDPARWPYYMYADKYTDEILMIGRGGLNSTGGLAELEDALQHGTPEYIVWGYGMNDGKDSGSNMHATTYKNHIEFLEICKQHDIVPIFLSSVNCATNYHSGKIDYVSNRLGEFSNYEYRVASLPHAVDGYEEGAMWYEGMLSSDNIHPTALGARNFYMELLCAFPELAIGADSTVLEAKSEKLNANSKLTINTPDVLDGEYAFIYNADFYDRGFDGAIEIGNGKDVNGGTWVKITDEKVEVFRNVKGTATLVAEIDNMIDLEEIFMIKIHVKDNVANISFVSSAEKEYVASNDRKAMFGLEAPWSYAGDAFAVFDTIGVTDASLKFVSE